MIVLYAFTELIFSAWAYEFAVGVWMWLCVFLFVCFDFAVAEYTKLGVAESDVPCFRTRIYLSQPIELEKNCFQKLLCNSSETAAIFFSIFLHTPPDSYPK